MEPTDLCAAEAVRLVEHAQARVSRELHDGLAQTLAATNLAARMLEKALEKAGAPQAAEAAKLCELLTRGVAETRAISRGASASSVRSQGLRAALELLMEAASLGVPHTLEFSDDFHCEREEEARQTFRMVQEASAAALERVGVSEVRVRLWVEGGKRWVEVRDDGETFDVAAAQAAGSASRLTLLYRARAVGAQLHTVSTAEAGTTVRWELAGGPEV